MDSITRYEYWYGGLESLKHRDITNLNSLGSTLDIQTQKILDEISSGGSKIIVPKFLGVYQVSEMIAQTQEERELKGEIELLEESAKESLDKTEEFLLEIVGGINTNINPDLIHIGYDPNIYTKRLVKDFFGENLRGIAISSYNNLPDFNNKDTVFLEMIVDKLMRERIQEREDLISIKKKIIKFSEEQKIFGLNRSEYLLTIFENLMG